MIRVSIEVRGGAAAFRVGVRASSIERAVSLAKGLYPASDAWVVFPIDAEGFFVEDPFAREGVVATEMAQEEKEVA
jgi:hypothetical protein